MNEKLFVVAKTVQLVKDGKVLCLVRIEGRGKYDAVGNAADKDFAGYGVALDAAGSERRGEVKEVVKDEESSEWRVTSGEKGKEPKEKTDPLLRLPAQAGSG